MPRLEREAVRDMVGTVHQQEEVGVLDHAGRRVAHRGKLQPGEQRVHFAGVTAVDVTEAGMREAAGLEGCPVVLDLVAR